MKMSMNQVLKDIALRYDTDKSQSQEYLDNYERYFSSLRDNPIRLLELGVLHGGSLLTWRDYFPNGLIVGLDLKPCPLTPLPDRVRFYQGSQADAELLERMSRECAPGGWDIVIDDASHMGTLSRQSFRHLYMNHVRSPGMYVIEDWGTGYWGTWPDGRAYEPAESPDESVVNSSPGMLARIADRLHLMREQSPQAKCSPEFASHNFGMVGLVKELIDEVAWPDISHPVRSGSNAAPRASTIRELHVSCGHVFVRKP